MDEGIFAGGSEKDLSNREFNPNIPSEEIFTTPKSGVADGIVYSSKPLSYQGKLIENFSIEFKDGKAVAVKAETGQEDLEKMIAMDEGAARLGECALIGKNSPINNLNILFYSTLYDENASWHFAMGRGFDICVENFAKYTKEELISLGVNDSMIHVDFMIGTDDLEVSGITEDGTEVAIFRNGDWVF
jgi:aminopeptidase